MVYKETSLKMVYKGNAPEDGLQRKRPWCFTKETTLKMVYKGNFPEVGLQRKPLWRCFIK
jgi:hypothetical protein